MNNIPMPDPQGEPPNRQKELPLGRLTNFPNRFSKARRKAMACGRYIKTRVTCQGLRK